MWFYFLKATEPLQGECLLFNTNSSGVPGAHLVDLGMMKGRVGLGATQWFLTLNPWIENGQVIAP